MIIFLLGLFAGFFAGFVVCKKHAVNKPWKIEVEDKPLSHKGEYIYVTFCGMVYVFYVNEKNFVQYHSKMERTGYEVNKAVLEERASIEEFICTSISFSIDCFRAKVIGAMERESCKRCGIAPPNYRMLETKPEDFKFENYFSTKWE